MSDKTTHFGYQDVPWDEKPRRVKAVFDSVAGKYDVMNDLMSLGVHRAWKRYAVELAAVRPGEQVLDLAAGTGDLAAAMAPATRPDGRVVLADYNAEMLSRGRDRMLDEGLLQGLDYVQADAESLPFADQHFHCVTMAFGLRNVRDKQAALDSIFRVLKPGGRLLVLEFSQPVNPLLRRLYDRYSFDVLPRLGAAVAGDADSYQYLAESIRKHPGQEELKAMFDQAGFARTQYFNLSGGIVAVHRGYRI